MTGPFKAVVGTIIKGPSYLIYPGHFDAYSRTVIPDPSNHGLSVEEIYIRTSDDVRLHTWLLIVGSYIDPSKYLGENNTVMHEYASTRPTVVIFHANGGNIGDWLGHAKKFHMCMHCNVFMVEYRGFGKSEGRPSESGIRKDAQAALDFLDQHPVLSQTPKILYGVSFGGAVAIDLASYNHARIHGLILENTFISIHSLIRQCVPCMSPFASLFVHSEKWDSASKIPDIPNHIHILLLAGLQDRVVPPNHMRTLWKLFVHNVSWGESRRCHLSEYRDGGHNNTCNQPGYWKDISSFLKGF